MKVLFITNVPSPYRVKFFNCLSQYCELTVLYEKEKSDERNEKWSERIAAGYTSVFLEGIKTGTDHSLSFQIVKFLSKEIYDFIVICGIASPTEMLAIQWCQWNKIPYCIEGDGAFSKGGRGFKEQVKKHFIKHAKLCFSTGKLHDQYYLDCGALKEKIVRYPFTSLSESDLLREILPYEEKSNIRKALGISEKYVVLAVGQFIYRKGFDVLMDAAKIMDKEIGIYIVGGEPTKEYISCKTTNSLAQVHFVGFKTKDELVKYYEAADIFVLPTREDIWGLVINEAMAYGLPVITTKKCAAGMELIIPDGNGYLVDVESPKQVADGIINILANEDMKTAMGRMSLQIIGAYTIEKMAKRHMQIFSDKESNV